MHAGGSMRGMRGGSMRGVNGGTSTLKKAASALALNDLVRQSMSSRGEGTSRRGSVYFAGVDENIMSSVENQNGGADVGVAEEVVVKVGVDQPVVLAQGETLQEKAQRASHEWPDERSLRGEGREHGQRGGQLFSSGGA